MIFIKEYIYIVQNGEAFRVYATSKESANIVLSTACKKYAKTNNAKYKNYWNEIHDHIINEEYEIMENTDFCGVRKIV